MCIDFDGHHSGGSSFVYINDFLLLQKLFVYYKYKYSSEKEQVNESPSTVEYIDGIDSIMPRTSVRILQSGRTGIRGA